MKITDPAYSLPIVEALTPLEQFENSANKPLLVSGIDTHTGNRSEYVIKLNGAERMGYTVPRCKELIAAFMAMELGIPVVEPAIVNLSAQFIDTTKGRNDINYATVSKSLGYNVGSKYIKGLNTLAGHQNLTPKQLELAHSIFAFDVLIQNADRTFEPGGKPNMMTDGEKLVLLDHELAFSFIEQLSFVRNKTPWIFNESDILWIKRHILFKHIEHQTIDYAQFSESLCNFDAQFWEQVDKLVPQEWKSEEMETIKSHVDSIIENRGLFAQSLNRLV